MKNRELYKEIKEILDNYQKNIPLPGLSILNYEDIFIKQVCDSIRRIEYTNAIKKREISNNRINPNSSLFDPIKGAILYLKNGDLDEACWLTFLFTHFGKNYRTNYNLIKNFYGAFGSNNLWTWVNVINDIAGMKDWLDINKQLLKSNASFGNHRKYQSLDAYSNNGTGATIESYINLVGHNHKSFFNNIDPKIKNNRNDFFDYLYKLINKKVKGFGRLAAFDFLTMIGKIGIVDIEPQSPYIHNSTGPKEGAKLLFGLNNGSNNHLNDLLQDLAIYLNKPFSMQIIEDAACNGSVN